VAVHALANIGKVRANQTVAVFGAGILATHHIRSWNSLLSAGPVGLLTLAVAKAFGAKRIISIDIVQSRLEFAKSYAATDIYVPSKKTQDETNIAYSRRNAAEMKKKLGIEDRGEKGVDVVVDASGAEVSIQTAIYLAKEGGKLAYTYVTSTFHSDRTWEFRHLPPGRHGKRRGDCTYVC
jgi:D-xylulose reductase